MGNIDKFINVKVLEDIIKYILESKELSHRLSNKCCSKLELLREEGKIEAYANILTYMLQLDFETTSNIIKEFYKI